jgi:DNA repair protein RecO (recombination protein O)
MPGKTVEAIILQVKPYGESDLIVDFFSVQEGRKRGIAKGAKKSKKRFVHCLEPLNLVRLAFFEKQNFSLVRLEQGEVMDPFSGIRHDFRKWGQAAYFCELIKELFAVGDINPPVFELVKESLKTIELAGDQEVFLIFQIRLLKLAGYGLYLNGCLKCGKKGEEIEDPLFSLARGGIFCSTCLNGEKGIRLSPGSVQSIRQSMAMNLPQVFRIRFSKDIRSEIENVLGAFSRQLLGKELGAERYLKQIQENYG